MNTPGLTAEATDIEKLEWMKLRLAEEGLSYVEVPAPTYIRIPALEAEGKLDLDLWLAFVESKLESNRAKGYFFKDSTDELDEGQLYLFDSLNRESLSLIMWGEGQPFSQFKWEDAFHWAYCAWDDGWDYGESHCDSDRVTFLMRELNYSLVDLPEG